jgi:hypothetical protein
MAFYLRSSMSFVGFCDHHHSAGDDDDFGFGFGFVFGFGDVGDRDDAGQHCGAAVLLELRTEWERVGGGVWLGGGIRVCGGTVGGGVGRVGAGGGT